MDINLALGYTCYVLDTHMDQHRNPLVVFALTICSLLQFWLLSGLVKSKSPAQLSGSQRKAEYIQGGT